MNHWLEFCLHATVEKTRSKSARVPVAVWKIDEGDERNLDRYEGVPTYYVKRKVTVQMRDGSENETVREPALRRTLRRGIKSRFYLD